MVGRRQNGAGRASTAATGRPSAPDIYHEMLTEAGVSSRQQPITERPLKRRRVGRNADPVEDGPSSATPTTGLDKAEQSREAIQDDPVPAPTLQTMERDSDESEDEDVEFEDVDFEAWLNAGTGEGPSEAAGEPSGEPSEEPAELELNLTAQRSEMTPKKKSAARAKPLSREEKERRLQVHQMHLLCLLSHVAKRNHWCNDPKVQDSLRSLLPKKTVTYLNPGSDLSQFGWTNSLKTGLQQVAEIWNTKFEITERGLRRSLWAENPEQLQDYEAPDDMESCLDREDFRHSAKRLEGSRDVGAQLYCALLRAAGVRARLVCSLQPLACVSGAPVLAKPKESKQKASKASRAEQVRASMAQYEERSNAARASLAEGLGGSTALRRLGHPGATAYDFKPTAAPPPKPKAGRGFSAPKRIRESPQPVYWVEVLDVGHQKWQPADPVVTNSFWKPKVFEPAMTDKENLMSYVIAFEADGSAKDVTRRYTKAYTSKTRRWRVENASEGGERWWHKVMKSYQKIVPDVLDQIEDNELVGVEAREPMPRNVQDFKDHPIYALERHLRRHEVLIRDAKPSGTISAGRGMPLEKIYRRRDVKIARTVDKWYRMGREVLPNEIPAKWVPKRAQPKKSRYDDDREDEREKDDAGMPIYTIDQTEQYEAPPVRDGKVPKNKFGNIDLYVPSMIPRGGVHIEHEQASRAAYVLGVDYAPALTGFSFKGRQGSAVLNGIVVAKEYEEAIRGAIEGLANMEQEAEIEKRRQTVLRVWRKFIMGLRIRERVWAGVGEDERMEAEREAEREAGLDAEIEDAPSDVTEEFDMVTGDDDYNDEDYGGGGFLVD
ncbi:unnamed protein product [Clonostachys rosea f. rosea IK726]|uniref:Rad4 beta-hairpin domain-containing protein n=3 Tax=Bionectria ochroleuca TaxID=29856 RepID=A0A0B7JSM2_BIOOC|nr:unnamed protein product [Clonostachys rosea f. rosea IK726]